MIWLHIVLATFAFGGLVQLHKLRPKNRRRFNLEDFRQQ